MFKQFAKLFNGPEGAQILVILSDFGKGPEVKVYFNDGGDAASSVSMAFMPDKSPSKGSTKRLWAEARECFDKLELDECRAIVSKAINGGQPEFPVSPATQVHFNPGMVN